MDQANSSVPQAEVSGEVVLPFAEGFPQEFRSVGLRILERHGVSNPRPGSFYPFERFLNAMKEISDNFTHQMLYRIGEQVALNAVLPTGIDGLEKCLASMDAAYHMNHRGPSIGGLVYKRLGQENGLERATITCRNPYPCSFERGVIQGFATRFKPSGSHEALVRHDDAQPCRRKGHDSCVYIISWLEGP